MSQRETIAKINRMGKEIVANMLARASLGDYDAQKALLPYIVPKAVASAMPISEVVEIDISTSDAAKESLRRVAAAIGEQKIGLQEGTEIMDAIGRALERISVADIGEITRRIEELETKERTPSVHTQGRQPVSRANGSTPTWGNLVKIDDFKKVSGDPDT